MNLIEACCDGKTKPVDPRRRRAVVVHRCGMGEDAMAISQAFQAPGAPGNVTGHHMPYTIVVTRAGRIEQALRIGDCGPHALAWNITGIGVAMVGDLRSEPPTALQRAALIQVCSALSGWLGGASVVWGHDELRNASTDPLKECPGRFLDMGAVRRDVELASIAACESAGIVF